MKKVLFVILATGLILVSCTTSKAVTPVTGTWLLISYGPESSLTTTLPDLNRSVIFDGDGNVSGNVGCNSFKGTYAIEGAKVIFQPMVSTPLNCTPDSVMKQEQATLRVLSGSADFVKADNTHLTISKDDEILVFEYDGY